MTSVVTPRRERAAAVIRDALSSKSVDEEVLDYVRDVLLDLAFDEEEEDARDVETMTENIGPMVEAFLTEKEVADVCARVVEIASESGGSDGARNEREAAGTTSSSGKFLIDLQNIILGFGAKILLKPTALRLEKNKRYGIVGQNGAGKTTFMNRIAANDILGFPEDVSVTFVRHEILSLSNATVAEFAKEKEEDNDVFSVKKSSNLTSSDMFKIKADRKKTM